MAGPIEQFEISRIVPIKIGGVDLSFTNSSAYMLGAVVPAGGFLLLATSPRSLIPGRLQSSVEIVYEFVSKMLTENAGEEGKRFFPLVFSLFIFVLAANLIGMFPYPTSLATCFKSSTCKGEKPPRGSVEHR